MRTRTKWAIGGGVALVGLLAGLGYYEHTKNASSPTNPGGIHLQPVKINPNGGAVVNVPLADGQAVAHVRARVDDIVNVVLPVNSFVSTASYGKVAWGTGAASGSKVVSVQLSGPTAISVTWTDTNVPAKYTTSVQVTT